MIISEAEIDSIIRGAADSDDSAPGDEIRRMLSALPDFEFQTKRASPLVKLCATGAEYGWRELERRTESDLLADVSARARASLRRNLRRDLEQITRPSFDLEWKSFGLALTSLGLQTGQADPKLIERMFLRDKPSYRLFSLFRKFPVLVRLWCQLICQWREHVREILERLATDRRTLSRTFFSNRPIGRIVDARFGLSDRHNFGRTVVRLRFEAGSTIYKPRSGAGEWEWFSLLDWMNRNGFQPKLRIARVLRRKGYCWMEWINVAPCKNRPATRRFYERMGALIAVAYLLRAVDCHRDNLIASGEDPVLVDAETLWHVSSNRKPQTTLNHLTRTGFFPNSNSRSLQSRSSVLGRAISGKNAARIGTKAFTAAPYQREIAKGFGNAWRCILGTQDRYKAFAQRVRRIRSRERRRIYWPTEKYAAIKRASIQPAALRSGIERHELLARSCRAGTVDSDVIELEVEALRRLDIPYFLRGSNERSEPDQGNMPADVCESLRLLLAECFG